MNIGVMFPTTEIGNDVSVIRDFAQAAEDLGYRHIMLEEHILAADPTSGSFRENGWTYGPGEQPMPLTEMPFHEPFVMMGWLAAATRRIGLGTSVLVVTLRQTALVAKQAAEVDLLSQGRLRLGIGSGWNPVEFEALGVDFHNRGQREEEQIELLRQLWTNRFIDFTGQWHRVDHAGLIPRAPRQIPIWIGGNHDVALKRAARLGDGYIGGSVSPAECADRFARLMSYVRAENRDPTTFGLETRTLGYGGTPGSWLRDYENWKELGVTHLSLVVRRADSEDPYRHIRVMQAYREAMGDFAAL